MLLFRKITPKSLDAHPVENALIIHCEAEVSVVNDTLDTNSCLVEKSKSFDKVIRLQSFNQDSDIDQLCRDVISQSEKLILPSQEDEVKKLLVYLKNRKSLPTKTIIGSEMDSFRPRTANPIAHSNSASFISRTQQNSSAANRLSYSASTQSMSSLQELIDYQAFFKQIENDFKESETIGKYYVNDRVSITQLNEHIDLLYEEMPRKLIGALNIFRLSLENENLSSLTTDESLLCALSRILREEGRKSNDLSSLILAFFCSLSFFREFHPIIAKYKVGNTSIELIGSLFEKEAAFYQQLKLSESQSGRPVDEQRTVDGGQDAKSEVKSDAKSETKLGDEPLSVDQLLTNRKKFELFQRKNNRLLQLSFFLLLNLSNDPRTEQKIFNKNIVTYLINASKRSNLNLEIQLIIITFLQRLSIRWEGKNQLVSLGVVPLLYGQLNNIVNQVSYYGLLMNPLFKLIFNLSFDQDCRTQMIKQGYINKLVQILIKSRFRNEKLLLSIFYQFTLERAHRNLFNLTLSTGKNLLNLFMNRTMQLGDKLVHEFSPLDGEHCFTEYVCLMINLATDKACAERICENGALEKLLVKTFNEGLSERNCSYLHICYMKILRNLSAHEHAYKMLFLEYYEPLIQLLLKGDENDGDRPDESTGTGNHLEIFTIQALNVLANLQKVSWLAVLQRHSLYEWLRKRIKVGSNFNNEIVISCLAVLEACFSQADCAAHLIETDCLQLLIDLLNAKQEEDDMVLQILYVINAMANHERICEHLIKNDQIIVYLLDLFNDKNQQIRSVCNFTLDLISEHDQDLIMRLKEERFKYYNKSWLDSIKMSESLSAAGSEEERDEQFEQFFQNDLFASQNLFSLNNLSEEELTNDRFESAKSKMDRSKRPQTAKYRWVFFRFLSKLIQVVVHQLIVSSSLQRQIGEIRLEAPF